MRLLEDVAHLGSCTSLTSLDLGSCKLEDNSILEELVVRRKAVRVWVRARVWKYDWAWACVGGKVRLRCYIFLRGSGS
jgi:hypothetical protein